MDVLQPHAAKMLRESAAPLELSSRVCDVCLEQRTNPSSSYGSSPTVACVAKSTTVAPKSASLVTVRLPRAVQDASTVVIDPLNSTVVILGCAALPAVCAPVAEFCRVAVVNSSDKPIEMLACVFCRFCQHFTSRLEIVSSHCYCPSPAPHVKTPKSAPRAEDRLVRHRPAQAAVTLGGRQVSRYFRRVRIRCLHYEFDAARDRYRRSASPSSTRPPPALR